MKAMKICLVVGLVLSLAGIAEAISVDNGPVKGKFEDLGSFYVSDSGAGFLDVPNPNPNGVFEPVFPGYELRNIFNVTEIKRDATGAIPSYQTFPGSSEQLTGILAGITPNAPVVTNPGVVQLIDLPADGFARGVVRLYVDDVTAGGTFFTDLGPSAWTSQTTYPTVTDGTLWIDAEFVPFAGEATGTVLLEETVNLGSNTGAGSAYLHVLGGSFAQYIQPNGRLADYIASGGYMGLGIAPPGQTVDVHIEFDLNANEGGAPPWGNTSEDPFRMTVVPEPITMFGAMMGVGGLLHYIRRRRQA